MNSAKIAEKLSLWIEERVAAAGSKGVVLGLSGGVDSSVVAVLCQRAFPRKMLGVIMPCYSHNQDIEHARMLSDQFSIPTKTVVLDSTYDTLLKALPDEKASPEASRLAKANLKARLRMLTLYYFANRLDYLVVGSGNRDELALGYFTKYGDGGVDIQPLGSLLKGQVKELAQFLGIPRPIIDKPPSAGLWEGQTDEGELGFSYEELDRYLASGEASAALKAKFKAIIAAAEHKRQPPPVADLEL
ncbi:MAG: NAD(+) synthase [Dehalococcoidales bacterium]|nr:NAD(+) synthase [Dehalococcoidales bacterium]